MQWLRRLVAGLLPRTSEFSPRSVHVRFLVDKVALGHVFLWVVRFPRKYYSIGAFHTHIFPGGWTIGPLLAAVWDIVSARRHEGASLSMSASASINETIQLLHPQFFSYDMSDCILPAPRSDLWESRVNQMTHFMQIEGWSVMNQSATATVSMQYVSQLCNQT
jgi:hypothetical protein